MDNYRMEQYRVYYHYRAQELYRAAEHERLADIARSGAGLTGMRFYYPAVARFGHWLMVSGQRLQKRYGDLCSELPANGPTRRPLRRNVSGG